MPWMRTGDNAATYPALMSVAGDPGADERTVNEVFGFVTRCATLSAAHLTDYVIDAGTANMIGGARTPELIRLCVDAGLLEPTTTTKGHTAWVLHQDPEFIHIRLKAEIEWERQQRRDTQDPALVVPVRHRDGDNCRWCGVLVQYRGKKTNRAATIDHLEPGKPGTVDTLVVACLGCNSARKDNVELWADNHQLRPAPSAPRYGKWTAKYLTDNGWPVEANVSSDDAAPQAAADPAPDGVRPAAPAAAASARPEAAAPQAARPAPTPPAPKSPGKSTPQVVGSSSPGSGRDGSGIPRKHLGASAPPPASGSSPPQAARPSPPTDQFSRPNPRRRRGKRGGRRSRPRGDVQ